MAGPLAAAATKMLEKVWGAVALTCHSAEGNLMSLVCQVWDMALEKQIICHLNKRNHPRNDVSEPRRY